MTRRRSIPGLALLLLLSAVPACRSGADDAHPSARAGSYPYELHDAVFAEHVTPAGYVRYATLADDPRFRDLVAKIGSTDPAGLAPDARLAFWINAYNVLVLEGVLRFYPVESVTKTRVLHGFFKRERFVAAGRELTLDDIEHGILRSEFEEPRIHFALVCGAASCPPLRGEAYQPERIDAQLRDQARLFFSDTAKNRLDREQETLHLSSILDWFGEDFLKKGGSLQEIVAPWFPESDARWIRTHPRTRIQFLPYDWSLNDASEEPRRE